MTVFALLSVTPVREGDMAADVAAAVDALEDYDVAYETNPMATTIEADDVGELFEAVEAAHRAVEADRVSTVLKIDDKRSADHRAQAKVAAVEAELGREARSDRES
ncbi:MAG: MTH1187 family thiamine-binding protein [Halodesulfurarchaeum sp.]